ncbi:MAG: hypothetical protein NZ822_03285 [Patescibacteria group bacterium]|nr:hypothetical protein [Patescibacteria group bacterium]
MKFKKVISPTQSNQREEIKKFWKPTKAGEKLTGLLKNAIPNKGKLRNNYLYLIKTDNDELVGLMGSTILNRELPKYVNHYVRITYLGKARTRRGTDVLLWELEVSEDKVEKNEDDIEIVSEWEFS